MTEPDLTLANYPYRGGVLYASARAAAAAVRRALNALDRGDHATAADTLRHALELIEPRLAKIDAADQMRLARLAAPHAPRVNVEANSDSSSTLRGLSSHARRRATR